MRFRSYDSLRLFQIVAEHLSFTSAADELNLTKGAVSYQMKRLEQDLGFALFRRQHRGIVLTDKGKQLWHASQVAFRDLDRQISGLREEGPGRITIGMATYFASRWLSPRLMTFTSAHPQIGLRLQPLTNLIDLAPHSIDMAIRWGRGDWTDLQIEPLLPCPAFPTAGTAIAEQVERDGLQTTLSTAHLLHDQDGSSAWRDWFDIAGLPYHPPPDELVIPDPNVRVQAVIDGQGIALYDRLVSAELAAGQLFQVSPVTMDNYGYFLAYPRDALENPALRAFRDWIVEEAR